MEKNRPTVAIPFAGDLQSPTSSTDAATLIVPARRDSIGLFTGRLRRHLALFSVCLAVLTAATSRAALQPFAPLFTRISAPVTLAAESVQGTLLVDVTINGAGPFHLLVDTGCSGTVISPEVALAVEARSFDAADYVPVVNALGETGAIQHVILNSVELGGARFEGVEAGVTSLDLQSRVTGRRIDGLLGYGLFADLFLTLDFPGQRLLLSADWPQDLPPVQAELDLTERDGVPFVALQTQGRTFEMMIDSGATGGLLFDVADAASLAWKSPPRPAGLVAAVGGADRDWIGRLPDSVTLGGVRHLEPVAGVTRGTSRIGAALFRSHALVLNPRQGKAWLCSASADPIPPAPLRSLGISLLSDEAGWRIVGTIPGGPAEAARLAPGDVITSIANAPAQAWTRDELQSWIDRHETVALNVTTSSGRRELTLPVWRIVP